MSTKKEPTGLQRNISLRTLTTFKIGGPAKYFLAVNNKEQIIEAISWAQENSLPFFILAGGSNLLVADKGFDGLAIKVQSSKFKVQSYKDKAMVFCEAGARLSDLVKLSLDEGLSGLEWAAGIPQATVGGAVWGNAGAFGKNMADVVSEVEVLQIANCKLQILKQKDCEFRYKDSVFKQNGNLIISSAVLTLKKKNQKEVQEEIKKILKYRKEHHPIEPSAGSVFKNIKLNDSNKFLLEKFSDLTMFSQRGEIPAGFLVEQCGLKGKKIGGAQISPKHANFIVNMGNAKAKDVKKMIDLAKKEVKKKFGIVLEEEIQYLGF